MKKSTRFVAALMAATMVLSTAACGSSSSSSSSTADAASSTTTEAAADDASAEAEEVSDDAAAADGQVYKIGIVQQLEHPALDAATQGFQDALTELLGADNVEFDLQNAQGEQANCATISNNFVSNNYDLILANATTALQSAAAATSSIPILGTSVTDYATALEIDDWTGATGRNISGTSDLAPIDEQEAMLSYRAQ
jgi:putative ABC transport system substrate-binding protein